MAQIKIGTEQHHRASRYRIEIGDTPVARMHSVGSEERAMGDAANQALRVSDLRQYVYCPRIIYFNYVIPVPRHKTVKMEVGRDLHADFAELEKRRTLAKYHLDTGRREFCLALECPKLNLTGILDMLITTDTGLFPVEFKNTTGDMGLHHKYQLAAYAMLVESKWKRPVREGFVYALPGKRVFRVGMDDGVRVHVKRIIGAISNLVRKGIMPPRTRVGGRCRDCEFRNYCGDA